MGIDVFTECLRMLPLSLRMPNVPSGEGDCKPRTLPNVPSLYAFRNSRALCGRYWHARLSSLYLRCGSPLLRGATGSSPMPEGFAGGLALELRRFRAPRCRIEFADHVWCLFGLPRVRCGLASMCASPHARVHAWVYRSHLAQAAPAQSAALRRASRSKRPPPSPSAASTWVGSRWTSSPPRASAHARACMAALARATLRRRLEPGVPRRRARRRNRCRRPRGQARRSQGAAEVGRTRLLPTDLAKQARPSEQIRKQGKRLCRWMLNCRLACLRGCATICMRMYMHMCRRPRMCSVHWTIVRRPQEVDARLGCHRRAWSGCGRPPGKHAVRVFELGLPCAKLVLRAL